MKHKTEIGLFCVLPCALLAGGTALATGATPQMNDIALFGLVPLLWVFVPLMALSAIAVFLAHFEHSVPNWAAWTAITASALLTILLFAALHARSGVMCTAPVCPESQTVSVQDPALIAPLGTRTDPPRSVPDDPGQTVALDRRVSSALYFSTVTFTTLGYGDFQPVPRLRLIAGFQALMGYLFLGLLVGSAIDYLTQRKTPPGGGVRKTEDQSRN